MMHYGLKTHEITVTTGDSQHTVKGIVTTNTTSEDTGTFDNMTCLLYTSDAADEL